MKVLLNVYDDVKKPVVQTMVLTQDSDAMRLGGYMAVVKDSSGCIPICVAVSVMYNV